VAEQTGESSTLTRIKDRLTARTVVAIVIAVLALVLLFQNTRDVQVHLFFWHLNRPLWLMLLILFAAGFVVGSFFPWFHRRPKASGPSS
jgi:uncharacterized integral membrane protein